MTKYILNSGGLTAHPKLKREFHQEIIKTLSNEPHFLLVPFAQPRETWEAKFAGYQAKIAEDLPKFMRPTFELATPSTLSKQARAADVLYIPGGDDHLLQYWMKQFDLKSLFDDKIVATNSASSDMLADSFWTCDWRSCMDGLGVVKIKFIPHYQSKYGADDPRGPIDWGKAQRELAAYGDPDLPIVALKEGEYTVIEHP
jgi:peptidase E